MTTFNIRFYYLLGTLLFLYPNKSMPQHPLTGLPGSESTLKDAVVKADLIVSATLKDLGGTSAAAPGRAVFDGARIEIRNVLKGAASGIITVSIIVRLVHRPGNEVAQETPPVVGKEYIFCIKSDNTTGQKTVFKMLPMDNATLNAVKAAIALAAK